MNKVLHALVYVILALACAALFFEMKLFDKRALLGDRNRMLEDYIVKIARTIEKQDAAKATSAPEARRDVSPVEAKAVDTPETENALEDWHTQLEEANLETFNWDNTNDRLQLRQVYFLENGEVVPDIANGNKPMMKGKGTMAELLDTLFDRCKAQQANLNNTRAELASARSRIEALVTDYNKLKPPARLDKMALEEMKGKIEEAEKGRQQAEEQTKKIKGQIDDLNAEVTSLKDEVSTAKDETEAVKEDLAKSQKLVEQLKKLLQQQAQQPVASSSAQGATMVAKLTAGDKGKLIEVNNKLMFAIVEFSEDGIKELLGEDKKGALPRLEMGLKRDKEYVGRIRLRQAVQGKNYVVVDMLGDWQQKPAEKGDVVFAE